MYHSQMQCCFSLSVLIEDALQVKWMRRQRRPLPTYACEGVSTYKYFVSLGTSWVPTCVNGPFARLTQRRHAPQLDPMLPFPPNLVDQGRAAHKCVIRAISSPSDGLHRPAVATSFQRARRLLEDQVAHTPISESTRWTDPECSSLK